MLSVIAGISLTARQNSGAPALISGNRSTSYAELLDAIARISNYFADRRLKPRAKLFLDIADPDLRLIVMLAAMHAGLIPFALLEIGDLKGEVDFDYVVGITAKQSPDLPADLIINQAVLAGRLSDGALREFPDQPDDAILFIGSTTGTTGRRKLIAETWGVGRRKTVAPPSSLGMPLDPTATSWMHFKAGDRILSTFGDRTYFGLTIALQCLAAGSTHLRVTRDRNECLKLINLYEVSWIRTTPGVIGELMDGMDERNIACPSVKRIRIAGSLFDRRLVARIEAHFGAEISVGYAATEIGRISTGVITSADFEFGYVGELHPEVTLVTAGTRKEPAPLVMIHNPATYRPYYANGKTVPYPGKFYTLPDLGFAENGRLYLVGRDDEVFNVNGNKTAYSLIDAALRAEPGVRDVAVVSALPLGDAAGLVIGVVTAGAIDTARLAARVAETAKSRLALDHVRIFRLDAMPRNAFGKTDRDGVIAAYRRGP